nr:MAG TPA: hypothetical protein [Caudoviricetes sp.]DAP43415.1 MAG TPA: hypothetical protein [Caudoviricetes sp.]DAR80366.1 MAG TPA: hypothetical protein [Caudoviricetes sp.]
MPVVLSVCAVTWLTPSALAKILYLAAVTNSPELTSASL